MLLKTQVARNVASATTFRRRANSQHHRHAGELTQIPRVQSPAWTEGSYSPNPLVTFRVNPMVWRYTFRLNTRLL